MVACATALAFVVGYNLININITERIREIATIKVLGFYPKETHDYVFRETIILTLMGTVVGVPLGIWLHSFIMNVVKVDFVCFQVQIAPLSFAIVPVAGNTFPVRPSHVVSPSPNTQTAPPARIFRRQSIAVAAPFAPFLRGIGATR